MGRRIKKRYFESGNAVREVLYGYAGLSLAVAREWERFNDGGWGAWRIRREYLLKEAVRLFIYSDETDTEADEILLFRYVYDLSSNVAAILDENGEIVRVDPEGRTSSESNFVPSAAAAMCLFEYDAFGNNLYRATPNQPNSETAMHIAWNEIFPHHLAGKEWDPEARLYYFGYRWYEPQQGAFISRTPLGPLAEGTYIYCFNDPVNYFDPNGLSPGGYGPSREDMQHFAAMGLNPDKAWVIIEVALEDYVGLSLFCDFILVDPNDPDLNRIRGRAGIVVWVVNIIQLKGLAKIGGKLLFSKLDDIFAFAGKNADDMARFGDDIAEKGASDWAIGGGRNAKHQNPHKQITKNKRVTELEDQLQELIDNGGSRREKQKLRAKIKNLKKAETGEHHSQRGKQGKKKKLKNQHICWQLIPNSGYGPLRFDSPFESLSDIGLVFTSLGPICEFDEAICYKVESEGVDIIVSEGIIGLIECIEHCYYNSINLIGMSTKEVIEILGGEWIVERDDEEQDKRDLYCDELGCYIWEKDGYVNSITIIEPD